MTLSIPDGFRTADSTRSASRSPSRSQASPSGTKRRESTGGSSRRNHGANDRRASSAWPPPSPEPDSVSLRSNPRLKSCGHPGVFGTFLKLLLTVAAIVGTLLGVKVVVRIVWDLKQPTEQTSGTVKSDVTEAEVSVLLTNHDEFNEQVRDTVERLMTEPPLRDSDRAELRSIHIYLGPKDLLSELPGWLRERGYTLLHDSADRLDELTRDWSKLNDSFSGLAEQGRSGTRAAHSLSRSPCSHKGVRHVTAQQHFQRAAG